MANGKTFSVGTGYPSSFLSWSLPPVCIQQIFSSLSLHLVASNQQSFSDQERENPPAIGSIITYRFQELTKAGIPRFPSYQGKCLTTTTCLVLAFDIFVGVPSSHYFMFCCCVCAGERPDMTEPKDYVPVDKEEKDDDDDEEYWC